MHWILRRDQSASMPIGARPWFESRSGYCGNMPCECDGEHCGLRNRKARFDSSMGY